MKLNNANKNTGEGCPDCTDGYLVERINSKTTNTFLGCSEWPDCKYTKRGGKNPSPIKVSWSNLRDELDYEDDEMDLIDWGDQF
jgi:ssDNA-binding Zn-finger/Zn-ribbon topoisomerase 1